MKIYMKSLLVWGWNFCSLLLFLDRGAAKVTNSSWIPSDEAILLRTLFARYDVTGISARPVSNASEPVHVHFGMRLIQMSVDEKLQELRTSVWLRVRWYDELLTWDPQQYGGIEHVTIPHDRVWLPDVSLVNTADTKVRSRPADLMVTWKGHVFWAPHRQFYSACLIDVTDYPYDRHVCEMWFQAMSSYTETLKVYPYKNSPWDLETYLRSYEQTQEWRIISNTTERIVSPRNDAGMLLKFSQRQALCFKLTIQRRIGYFTYLLMLPCVFLSSMTLIVFWMPQERPDRNVLAMHLFGSFIVLLLLLVEVVPPSAASVPKLEIYYGFNISLVMCTVFCSGFSIHIQSLGEKRIPVSRLYRYIVVNFLSRLVFLHDRAMFLFPDEVACTCLDNLDCRCTKRDSQLSEFNSTCQQGGGVERTEVQYEPPIMVEFKRMRLLKMRWRFIAQCLDRIFFVALFVSLLISFTYFFPRDVQ